LVNGPRFVVASFHGGLFEGFVCWFYQLCWAALVRVQGVIFSPRKYCSAKEY
jgi:hypothetical protein